jgi:hypothetical protein
LHTQRLKAIQIPSVTLGLLESFAATIMGAQTGVRPLRTLDDLPLRQRERIGSGHDQQYVWYAWDEGPCIRLVTGALALERSRERGRPVLEVRIYDHNGLLEESGTWVRTATDRWERCDW